MNLRRTTCSLGVALGYGLLASTPAAAQETVLSRFETNVAGDAFFSVLGANVDGKLVPRGQLTFGYEHRPFVLTDAAGNVLAVPSILRVMAYGSASFSLFDRVLVSVDAPFAVSQFGETVAFGPTRELAPTEGMALGEVRAGVRVRAFGKSTDPFQVGAGGFVYVPTATDPWSGEGYVYGQPTVQFGGRVGMLRYGAHVGAKLRPAIDPTSLTFAGAVGVSLLGDALFVGPEFFGSRDLTTGKPVAGVLDVSTPLAGEVLVGAQYRFLRDFVIGASGGTSLTEALGAPEARAMLRLTYSPPAVPEVVVLPPPDRDRDTFVDAKDGCPDVAGVANADPTKNGCPPPPPDRDGDTIVDAKDACVDRAGVASSDPAKNGCPPDRDGDKVYDPDDGCPDEAGPRYIKGKDRGCPDRDKDLVADRSDACVDEFGVPTADAETNGCPRAVLTDEKIVINQRIEFALNESVILPESLVVVDAVEKILKEHPDIMLVEIQGHADDTGNNSRNVWLSYYRAKAVMDALVQRGILATRMRAKGYGSLKPLVKGDTDEARQRNRRVEFHVLVRKAAPKKPKPPKPVKSLPTPAAPTPAAPTPAAPTPAAPTPAAPTPAAPTPAAPTPKAP